MFAVPILSREMHVAGRKGRTFALRVFYVIGLALCMWMSVLGSPIRLGFDNCAVGRSIFSTFAVLSFFYVNFSGPAVGAGLMWEEKRANTLDLLFLTGMSSLEIVTGKLLAAFLQVELLVIAAFPLLCVSSIFGGVSIEQIAIVFCITSASALLAATIGLYFSTTSRSVHTAAMKAYLLFSMFFILPFFLYWIVTGAVGGNSAIYVSPFASLAWQIDNLGRPSDNWVGSIVTCLLLSVVLLRLSARHLARATSVGRTKRRLTPWGKLALPSTGNERSPRDGIRSHSARRRVRRPIEGNPVLWRELNKDVFGKTVRPPKPVTIALAVVVTLIALCTWTTAMIGELVVYMLLAVLFARVVTQERAERSLEILLTTPLSSFEIVNGKLLGLLKSKIGLAIATVLILAQLPFICLYLIGIDAIFLPLGLLNLPRMAGTMAFITLFSFMLSTVCKSAARAVAGAIVTVILSLALYEFPVRMLEVAFFYGRVTGWRVIFTICASLLPMLASAALYSFLIKSFRRLALRT